MPATMTFGSGGGGGGVGLTDDELRAAPVDVDVTEGLDGLATEAKLEAVRALLAGTLDVDTGLTDLSTETTLAAVLAKLSTDPATDTKLEAIRALLAGTLTVDTGLAGLADAATETTLAAVLAALGSPLDVDTGLTGLATDATAAAILAKLSSDPATQTTLAAVLAKLSSDPATQTTLAAVLAKLSSDPATQTTLAAVLSALQGTLTVGLPSGAATAANQATLNSKDFATQTTLAAVLAKLTADPATDTKLEAVRALLAGTLSVNTGLSGISTETTLAALSAKLPSALESARLAVAAKPYATANATGTLGSNGATVTAAVDGQQSATLRFDGTASLNVAFEVSVDGGTTYDTIYGTRYDTTSTTASNGTAPSGAIGEGYLVALPPGATHLRARCTAYGSGSLAVVIGLNYAAISPFPVIQGGSIGLANGIARVGFVAAAGIAYDETNVSATLAAGATGTSSIRDMTGGASSSPWASSATYGGSWRVMASGDQPFTLGVEMDNLSNITTPEEPLASVAASTTGRKSGRYNAFLEVPVVARYGRAYVTNTGASAMTTLRMRSLQIAT